jgi:hypothetical protein
MPTLVGVRPRVRATRAVTQQVRHGIAYLAVRSVTPVACHTLARTAVRSPPAPAADPGRVRRAAALPSGPAARRTVAAAAVEIHRALAAHVAATRPDREREQP